jgi:DNA-binding LytR/AlgR family response regulator
MFLDLHLPKIKGLDFLESLKQHPKVIITTAYPEYAVKSYEYDVVDYVLKPIEFSRFLTAVNKFVSNDKQNNTIQDFLFFNVNKKQVKVYYEDIDYIESQKEYVKIVTVNQTIITKYSISQLEKELPLNKFIRTHRSFIVNLKKILSFSHNEIVLNNQHIPIGRLYKDSTIAQLNTI